MPEFFARRLREYNKCHEPAGSPKGGQFASSSGPGDCGDGSSPEFPPPDKPVLPDPTFADEQGLDENRPIPPDDWRHPSRQRAVYGRTEDDPELLNPSKDEATEAYEFVESADENRSEAKNEIALALGPEIADLEGFEEFYNEFRNEIGSYYGTLEGANSGGSGQEPGPDPDTVKSEYEQYQEEKMQEIDEQFYSELGDEYKQQAEAAGDAVVEVVDAVNELWKEAQQGRETGPYGDTKDHPTLFGDRQSPEFDYKAFLIEALVGDDVKNAGEYNGRDWRKAADSFFEELDNPDSGLRDRLKEQLAQYDMRSFEDPGSKAMASDILEEVSTYFDGVSVESYNGADIWDIDTSTSGFDSWRDDEGGEADYSEIESFEGWYKDNYGHDPDEWSNLMDSYNGDDGGEPVDVSTYGDGEKAAAWLINRWADTSGDGSKTSIMLQVAAEQEFNLPTTYTKVYTDRGNSGLRASVDKIVSKHGGVLRGFLRAMYDNTQERLKEEGIEYVTLYRGFSISPKTERGLSSVNEAGDFVDVRLQPMSSYSGDFSTAIAFAGTSEQGWIMATRVHRSAVIGTSRTGFGAGNEFEWVVLGGRRPSYIMKREKTRNAASTFWKSLEKAKGRLQPRTTGAVLGPGDRG